MPAVGGRNEKAAEIFVRAYFHHGAAAFAAGGMAGRVFLEARGLFGVAERRVYAPEPADRAAYPVPRRRFGLQDRLDHPDPAAARDGRPAVPAVRRQAARAPDVCKIMDYSKFCFDQKKREKEAKKNQRVVEIKEIRMSPSIDTNDFNTKVKAAQKFLSDGNRVKVSVRFRGREMAHTNLGEKLLMDFAASCSEIAGMEKNPKLEGRFMAMFLTPKNSK